MRRRESGSMVHLAHKLDRTVGFTGCHALESAERLHRQKGEGDLAFQMSCAFQWDPARFVDCGLIRTNKTCLVVNAFSHETTELLQTSCVARIRQLTASRAEQITQADSVNFWSCDPSLFWLLEEVSSVFCLLWLLHLKRKDDLVDDTCILSVSTPTVKPYLLYQRLETLFCSALERSLRTI